VPDREIAQQLVDLVEGRETPALTTVVQSGLRFFGFDLPEGVRAGADLDLPDGARLIARTRGDQSVLADEQTSFEEGDRVVLIVEEEKVDSLRERFTRDGDDSDQ